MNYFNGMNLSFQSDFIEYKYLPGLKNLYLDYINGSPNTRKYYHWDYRKSDDYRTLSDLIDKKEFHRGKIAEILWKSNSKFGCGDKIKENIDRFMDPKSLVVISGQQVGIFGGPLYTFYKAAGVIKLAAELTEKMSRPVVPMFWMATEDHDYTEANTASIVNRAGEPIDIFNKPQNGQFNRSMSKITFGDAIIEAVNELDESLIPSDYTEPLFSLLRKFYKPGEKISDAFGNWMSSLFCGYGLILVDPSDPDIKELSIPIYEKEINRPFDNKAPEDSDIDDRIVKDGYHLQVQKFKKGLNLFYADVSRERILLNKNEESFILESSMKGFTKEELISHLYDDPSNFSSGVLLRPLVQSMLLPTIGFLGGPSEISYHAQLYNNYDYFDVVAPVIRPRPSVSMMGKRISSTIEKYNVALPELFTDHHKVISNVMIKHFPAGLDGKLNHLQVVISDLLNSVSPELEVFEDGLKQTFSTSTNKIDSELNKLKGKIFQAHKKKNSEITNQLLRVYDSFFPGGVMQERVLPIIYFLNKYSPAFAGKLFDAIDMDKFEHQIITINSS